MKTIFGKHWLKDLSICLLGCVLSTAAVYNFGVASDFPMTGFTGIAVIFYRLWGLPIGITTFVLNVPVALLCRKRIGRHFFWRSVFCILVSSVLIDYVAPLFPVYTGDRILAAICTGVIGGIGYGIIYMQNSSTGGTDFIVMAIKSVWPHIKLGTLISAADYTVVLLAALIFHDFDGAIYGAIIGFLFGAISDKLLYGLNSGRLALIITDHGKEVADRINEKTERGTTLIPSYGGYTDKPHDLVMCACSVKDIVKVERAVRKADPLSFTVILESHEVLGEGFKAVKIAENEEDAEALANGLDPDAQKALKKVKIAEAKAERQAKAVAAKAEKKARAAAARAEKKAKAEAAKAEKQAKAAMLRETKKR